MTEWKTAEKQSFGRSPAGYFMRVVVGAKAMATTVSFSTRACKELRLISGDYISLQTRIDATSPNVVLKMRLSRVDSEALGWRLAGDSDRSTKVATVNFGDEDLTNLVRAQGPFTFDRNDVEIDDDGAAIVTLTLDPNKSKPRERGARDRKNRRR